MQRINNTNAMPNMTKTLATGNGVVDAMQALQAPVERPSLQRRPDDFDRSRADATRTDVTAIALCRCLDGLLPELGGLSNQPEISNRSFDSILNCGWQLGRTRSRKSLGMKVKRIASFPGQQRPTAQMQKITRTGIHQCHTRYQTSYPYSTSI